MLDLSSMTGYFTQPVNMKQLDVDVSPPALVWTHHLTLNLLTFDLDADLSP